MSERVDVYTPVGRMVQGDPFTESWTGYQGKALLDKQGNPRSERFFAIAIAKTDPEWPEFWAALQQVAAQGFPGGQSAQGDFSWKVKDGDDPKYAGREGFAGHYVVGCSTGFAIKAYADKGMRQILDPAEIKKGYYIRAYVSLNSNGDVTKPGIFINPSMVELVGYGTEIIGGPDGAEVFGAKPAALPAGASATPVAGPTAGPGPGPGAPGPAAAGPAAAGPGAPGPAAAGPGAPGPGAPGVTAAHDFLTPGTAEPTMTALAAGVAYADFIAKGWTDKALIDGGYMVAAAAGAPGAPGAPAAPVAAPQAPTMTALAAGVPYADFVAKGWTDKALIDGGYMLVPF